MILTIFLNLILQGGRGKRKKEAKTVRCFGFVFFIWLLGFFPLHWLSQRYTFSYDLFLVGTSILPAVWYSQDLAIIWPYTMNHII